MSSVPPIDRLWEPPKQSDEGDQTSDTLYLRVGQALSSWEGVEGCFSRVFAMFMEANHEAAERVFGTLVANTAKLAALRQASAVAFQKHSVSEEDQKTWELLFKHYEHGSWRRTEIAHAVVSLIQGTATKGGFFLMPPSHNSKKTDVIWKRFEKFGTHAFWGNYLYVSGDLDHFIRLFGDLSLWTMAFHAEYQGRYLLPTS